MHHHASIRGSGTSRMGGMGKRQLTRAGRGNTGKQVCPCHPAHKTTCDHTLGHHEPSGHREHSVAPFQGGGMVKDRLRKAPKLVKTFPAGLDRVEPRKPPGSRTARERAPTCGRCSRRSLTVPGMGLLNVYGIVSGRPRHRGAQAYTGAVAWGGGADSFCLGAETAPRSRQSPGRGRALRGEGGGAQPPAEPIPHASDHARCRTPGSKQY